MMRKFGGFASLLLALTLALTACGGDVGVIGGADSPTDIYIDGDQYSISDDVVPPDESVDLPVEEPEDIASGEDEAPPEENGTTDGETLPYEDETGLDEDGTYNSAEDVSLYLYTYGRLPDNYITKQEARDLGWSGGSVERYAPGCAIGGDKFGNREGVLPEGTYHECDIDTIGQSSRGAKRLVYADDGRIYYTEDHYESFELLYGEE